MTGVSGLQVTFGQRRVLDGLDLEFAPGAVTAVVGSSGAGKSTLLRCVNLLERPQAGFITIGDLRVDTTRATAREIRELRRRTAMVFQQFHLFARKTATENVAEGLRVVRGIDRRDAERLALEHLDRVGLAAHADQYPSQLSGGQQQRVGIARALAMQPEVLLLDEPTSALDPELVGEVLATIRSIAEQGQTMVLVSHEMHFVRQVAQRIVFLEGGRIIDDAAPAEFFGAAASDRTRGFLREYHHAHGTYQI
ncbi:amino acid ABC transporter ATP-binding protein [Microbacterium protaetiae]|uniref:Amino acid ABC transporter ATP-binding protein n=1 Tax=Microbacterium protaetiae TaxID=2509458 RepID=A0A4P6EH36_9MICO|nr:amino acid ABC transporter ATP-binding protein [Microbacterium protaetiae]QAY60489.1 amino acid ABC transporter ATP-binding protein [Microbacterium protaetiae]